jgi:replicative DNA helicase
MQRRLPESNEAEAFLLGCCFIDGTETVAKCLETGLMPEDFYDPRHETIFKKILDAFTRGLPVDVAVIAEELKAAGELERAGGIPYLSQVGGCIPTTARAEYFVKRVGDLARLRAVIRVTQGITERALAAVEAVEEFVDQAEKEFFEVAHRASGTSLKSASGPVRGALALVDKMIDTRGQLTGVASGFCDLDRYTWGFQRAEMIVLAARPSMGKTALALNFADAALLPKQGAPSAVLIFSLEMSTEQLVVRMIASRARVNQRLLRDGHIKRDGDEHEAMRKAGAEIAGAPLYIDDSAGLTIMQLRAKARRAHTRHRLGLIIVDYLQLLTPTDSTVLREQQVSEASRGLKALAKELDVPVLVLSQLNRASEKENRPPRLADLRESGAIEQDADVVLMLARPKDAPEGSQVAADTADLIVAKNRNGPVGDLRLTFIRDITRFENHHA